MAALSILPDQEDIRNCLRAPGTPFRSTRVHLDFCLVRVALSLYSYLCGVLYIIVCSIVPLLIYNWPLYCLFFDMRLLVTLWYLQTFLTCSNEPFEWKVSASLKLQLYMVAVFIFIKTK